MRKLYIIEYSDRGASWYWANNGEEAKQEAKKADEATSAELEEAEIWEINDAVCKSDIMAAIDRYIIKPLKRN